MKVPVYSEKRSEFNCGENQKRETQLLSEMSAVKNQSITPRLCNLVFCKGTCDGLSEVLH